MMVVTLLDHAFTVNTATHSLAEWNHGGDSEHAQFLRLCDSHLECLSLIWLSLWLWAGQQVYVCIPDKKK